MPDQWLCLIDGQKLGPLTSMRLQQLAATGRLKPDDYVRPVDDEQWRAAKDIPQLSPAPPITQDRAETSAGNKHRSPPVHQAIIQPAVTVGDTPSRMAPPPVESAPSPVASDAPFIVIEAKPGESGVGLLHGPEKTSTNTIPLMIAGVAVVGVLAVVLVLVLSGVIDVSIGATPVTKAEIEKKPALPEEPGEFNNEESNAAGSEERTPAAATLQKQSPKKNALLASVTQFLDVTKRYRSNGRLAVQVSVTGLWLSADVKGEPYVAAAKLDGEPTPQFLVVKLKIRNAAGASPAKYQGWKDKAVLFDDAGEPIEPIAANESADQVADQQIEPGGSLDERLVFPLANVEFEKLRLVLPHDTVGIKDNRSFGLELPRHALGRGLDTREAGGDIPALEIVDKDPGPMPPAKAASAKPKDDLEELLKKLDAKAKERDEMEKKK